MAPGIPAFLGPLVPLEQAHARGSEFSLKLDALTLDVLAAGLDSAPELPVDVPDQSLGNWCWAATTAAIQAFYHEPGAKTQCEVATYWLAMPCCPPGPDVPQNPRNQRYDLSTTLAKNLAQPTIRSPLPPDQIVQQLATGHPVCCAIQWPNGDMHFNVIAGYNAASGDVIVHDPKYSRNEIPLDELRMRYRNTGRWVASLLTKKS